MDFWCNWIIYIWEGVEGNFISVRNELAHDAMFCLKTGHSLSENTIANERLHLH